MSLYEVDASPSQVPARHLHRSRRVIGVGACLARRRLWTMTLKKNRMKLVGQSGSDPRKRAQPVPHVADVLPRSARLSPFDVRSAGQLADHVEEADKSSVSGSEGYYTAKPGALPEESGLPLLRLDDGRWSLYRA